MNRLNTREIVAFLYRLDATHGSCLPQNQIRHLPFIGDTLAVADVMLTQVSIWSKYRMDLL